MGNESQVRAVRVDGEVYVHIDDVSSALMRSATELRTDAVVATTPGHDGLTHRDREQQRIHRQEGAVLKVLEAHHPKGMTKNQWANECVPLGFSKSTAERRINSLLDQGKVAGPQGQRIDANVNAGLLLFPTELRGWEVGTPPLSIEKVHLALSLLSGKPAPLDTPDQGV